VAVLASVSKIGTSNCSAAKNAFTEVRLTRRCLQVGVWLMLSVLEWRSRRIKVALNPHQTKFQ
jgi:hypothetical protein